MHKFTTLLAFFLTSGVASAHPGHEHVGNEAFHHTFEVLAAVAGLAITWRVLSHFRQNRAEEVSIPSKEQAR
ncbi:MAG: hypothetical protein AAF196_00870 [Planctomycetota bacterium]